MEAKKPWQSKTMIFNTLGVALEILQLLGQLNLVSPGNLALGLGIGNVLLRFITKQPVKVNG